MYDISLNDVDAPSSFRAKATGVSGPYIHMADVRGTEKETTDVGLRGQ